MKTNFGIAVHFVNSESWRTISTFNETKFFS